MAKRQLINSSGNGSYRLWHPGVYSSAEINRARKRGEAFVDDSGIYVNCHKFKFEDSWFVVFRPKLLQLFSVYYLVVIDRETGNIQYTNDLNALTQVFQGIFFNFFDKSFSPLVAVCRFYNEKGQWPSSGGELKSYCQTSTNWPCEGMDLENLNKVMIDKEGNDKAIISFEEVTEIMKVKWKYEVSALTRDKFEMRGSSEKDSNVTNEILQIMQKTMGIQTIEINDIKGEREKFQATNQLFCH